MKKINKPSLPLGFNHASFSIAFLLWILHFSADLYKMVKNAGEFDAAGEPQWLFESPDRCTSVTVRADTFL